MLLRLVLCFGKSSLCVGQTLLKRFQVLAEEWLPGGEEITPTMKLRRGPIAEKYAARIDALYRG